MLIAFSSQAAWCCFLTDRRAPMVPARRSMAERLAWADITQSMSSGWPGLRVSTAWGSWAVFPPVGTVSVFMSPPLSRAVRVRVARKVWIGKIYREVKVSAMTLRKSFASPGKHRAPNP